ncbi:hypothetical protein J4H46_04105 [Vibrio alginolyticus]|uniref:hypothetical protein n=1 Tax=Vibrio TaxID=662 RepID=UPI001966F4F5|nr:MULTISPECIES: hypothetical protein [Vibrio]EIV8672292.1 hypothetical protein [Vibrio parahaemolyticus]EHA1205324.1 hypothetical protein [Vibrio alginolyticus]ELA6769935.1 hypothetical protein [Vibrio alginolyticus]MBN2998805.1 hypothetical protein [Vibrio alginolyticus]MBT0097737.1 hypothetical protein [Vibrio alginolyticus]
MTNSPQAIIPLSIKAYIEAYLGLVTNPFYSNDDLGVNPNKLQVNIGAESIGAGTFSICHDTDVFTADQEDNARRISHFIDSEFLIYFEKPEQLNAHSEFAGICFEGKDFCSPYHHQMPGFPQFLYDFLSYLIENKSYSTEGALAIFGCLLHQITVPYWGEFMDEEELRQTEVHRLLGVHFDIVAAVHHDLDHSQRYHQEQGNLLN